MMSKGEIIFVYTLNLLVVELHSLEL